MATNLATQVVALTLVKVDINTNARATQSVALALTKVNINTNARATQVVALALTGAGAVTVTALRSKTQII
jgi:hypothetical protein